jgi:hypothetical protein
MREWRQDRLDEMLDDALASYGEGSEREGLERRVLAKVNERAIRMRPRGRLAMAMGAAAAAVCLLFWWEMPKATVQPRLAITATSKASKTGEPLLVRTAPARDSAIVLPRATKLRSTPRRPVEPKLARFPAPSPMSSEERALLRLATGDPKDIPRELTHSGDPIQPLRMAAIEIKPLE